MDDELGLGETFCDLSKARIVPYKNTWNHFKTRYIGAIYCSLKEEDCSFCQTRSNAVVLYDTLPAEFIETAICMKTKE